MLKTFLTIGLAAAGGLAWAFVRADDVPPVSAYAPAADLVSQARLTAADLENELESASAYDDNKEKVVKQAHSLAVIGQALGLHDTANELQASAPAIVASAKQLALAEDFAAAQTAWTALKSAMAGETKDGPALSWNEKVASLGKLMKHITFVNNRLRRQARQLNKEGEEAARHAAVLAVIGQSIQADTHEVKDPTRGPEWMRYSAALRDSAGEVNAAIHKADQAAVDMALRKLAVSCETCHQEFRGE